MYAAINLTGKLLSVLFSNLLLNSALDGALTDCIISGWLCWSETGCWTTVRWKIEVLVWQGDALCSTESCQLVGHSRSKSVVEVLAKHA
ncbi:hypothetical protein Ancab_019681 [Ancistrocladus abbreviatus]